MPKRLIPILSDEQVQQLADLRDHSPKPYLRERAGAILKLAHGLSASARALLSAAFLLALLLSYTSSALAQGNFVYINNNIPGGPNTVSAFSVGADCSLTPVPGSPFPTGGIGSGAGVGSANQAEVCGNNLYIAGAGGALTPVMVSPFDPSGDRDFNIQLSPDERFLFVSHFLTNTMSVMSVAAGGTLTEITGSPFPNTGGSFPSFAVTNASGSCLFALNLNQGATAFSIAADGSVTRVGAATGGSSATGGGIAAYPAASCATDLSVPQQITQLITQVQSLVTNGVLSSGQGAGLITKLNGVIAKLNSGQVRAACNQFNAFINQVNAFVNSGALSPEQGQALITAANNIRAQIGC